MGNLVMFGFGLATVAYGLSKISRDSFGLIFGRMVVTAIIAYVIIS